MLPERFESVFAAVLGGAGIQVDLNSFCSLHKDHRRYAVLCAAVVTLCWLGDGVRSICWYLAMRHVRQEERCVIQADDRASCSSRRVPDAGGIRGKGVGCYGVT